MGSLVSCTDPSNHQHGSGEPEIFDNNEVDFELLQFRNPRVLSTSDEMSMTQMRRALVYGPPGVESLNLRTGNLRCQHPRPSVVIEREDFAASSWGMVEIDVGRDR